MVQVRFCVGMKVLAAGIQDLKSTTAAQPLSWQNMSAAGRSQSRPSLMQWSSGRPLAMGLSNRAVWLAAPALRGGLQYELQACGWLQLNRLMTEPLLAI